MRFPGGLTRGVAVLLEQKRLHERKGEDMTKITLPKNLVKVVQVLARVTRVQGSGFRVQGAGCRVQISGFRVQDPGFRVLGSECRVLAFRVQG